MRQRHLRRATGRRPPLASPPDPGPPPNSDGLSADVRQDVARSTVRVTGIACGSTTEGSGFAVGGDLIATNAHVLVGLDTPTIELGDGTSLAGDIVAFNVIDDLALIRATAPTSNRCRSAQPKTAPWAPSSGGSRVRPLTPRRFESIVRSLCESRRLRATNASSAVHGCSPPGSKQGTPALR